MSEHTGETLRSLTAQIVSAHVGYNSTHTENIPALINSVYRALSNVGQPQQAEPGRPEPAVPIKRSVFPDYIVCLEDGRQLKMLKRYLASRYNMTPAEYRTRWGLPPDYPMSAPNYAARRSELAKEIGLGSRANQPGPRGGRPKKR